MGDPRTADRPSDAEVAERLRSAPFEPVGRFADASNATLLVRLTDRDARPLTEIADQLGREPTIEDLDPSDLAVHKPRRGESPLWDFPAGTLYRREVAAYEVSSALGWDLVPVTVVVADGPFGVGSLQRFVPHDPNQHYFHLLEHGGEAVLAQLRAMVVFDRIIDNADRKGGHVLLEHATEDAEGRLAGSVKLVDHGVSFNVDPKLRTVGWHVAGEEVPQVLRSAVARLGEAVARGPVRDRLAALLGSEELAVLQDRIARVAAHDVFPEPSGRNPFPWPML